MRQKPHSTWHGGDPCWVKFRQCKGRFTLFIPCRTGCVNSNRSHFKLTPYLYCWCSSVAPRKDRLKNVIPVNGSWKAHSACQVKQAKCLLAGATAACLTFTHPLFSRFMFRTRLNAFFGGSMCLGRGAIFLYRVVSQHHGSLGIFSCMSIPVSTLQIAVCSGKPVNSNWYFDVLSGLGI